MDQSFGAPVIQLYGRSFVFQPNDEHPAPTVQALHTFLRSKTGLPDSSFRFSDETGCILYDEDELVPSTIVRASFAGGLKAGKGGFGANLKSSGKGKTAGTADYGACRDLYGRRLSSVNAQIRLQLYLSRDEAEKKKALDSGWHLGLPGWADGKAGAGAGATKRAHFKASKRKTELCRDWLDARAPGSRPPPSTAPPWWGCPRGPRCEFAHGEDDLKSEVRQELAKQRKEENFAAFRQSREDYVSGIRLYDASTDAKAGIDVARALAAKDETDEAAAEVAARSMGDRRSMLATVVQGMRAAAAQQRSSSSSSSASSSSSSSSTAASAASADTTAGSKRSRHDYRHGESARDDARLVVPASVVAAAVGFDAQAGGNWAFAIASPDADDGCAEGEQGGSEESASVQFVEKRVVSLISSSSASASADNNNSSSSSSTSTSVGGGGGNDHEDKTILVEVEGKSDFSTVVIPGLQCSLSSSSLSSSSSSRAYYYEVELLTSGVMQIGWASNRFLEETAMIPLSSISTTDHSNGVSANAAAAALLKSKAKKAAAVSCPPAATASASTNGSGSGGAALAASMEEAEGSTCGIGDDQSSWSYDGHRALKFHLGPSDPTGRGLPYPARPSPAAASSSSSSSSSTAAAEAQQGEMELLPLGLWQEGDVVGCLLTLEKNRAVFRYSLNGKDLGVAFEETIEEAAPVSFSPALSLEGGEVCRVNIGLSSSGSSTGGFSYGRYGVAANIDGVSLQVAVGESFVEASPCAASRVSPDTALLASFAAAAAAAAAASSSSGASSSSSSSNELAFADGSPSAKRRKTAGEEEKKQETAAEMAQEKAASAAVTSMAAAPSSSSSSSSSSSHEVDLTDVRNDADLVLRGYSGGDLKTALVARGLKAGGTFGERAARLLAVKHLPRGVLAHVTIKELEAEVPAKLRGADFPGDYYR